MKNFTSSLVTLWQQLGINQRVSLMVAALAVAGVSEGAAISACSSAGVR